MKSSERRMALLGWASGALVAVGAYVGALQFIPAVNNVPVIASLQPVGPAAEFAVDPIITGSIGSPSMAPSDVGSVDARINRLSMEVASLREMVAASQAATRSANRRLEVLEQSQTLTTASIDPQAGPTESQPLPEAIAPLTMADSPQPRIVLPAPVPTDGGTVSVSMRPLDISTQAEDASDTMMDDMPIAEAAATPEGEVDMPTNPEPALISQTPFAVDIGGASTLEEIDALWVDRQTAYGATLDGMSPRILLQQTSEGALELRLVAGPFPDAADAALICAQLVAAGLERCLPAIFDGQQLALR